MTPTPETPAPALLSGGASFRHKKERYVVHVLELHPPPWPGAKQRVSFRRSAANSNGNYTKHRMKLAKDFLAEFEPVNASAFIAGSKVKALLIGLLTECNDLSKPYPGMSDKEYNKLEGDNYRKERLAESIRDAATAIGISLEP